MDVIFSHRFRAFLDYLRSEGKIYNDADFCRKINKKPLLFQISFVASEPLQAALQSMLPLGFQS